MSPVVHPRTAPARSIARGFVAATAVTLTLAAAGCTAAPGPVAVPSTASTSASAGASSSREASAPADPVTIDITIADGKVTPSGERVNVTQGQTVIFHVTSDVDDEVHAHTAGDGLEIETKAGKTVTAELVASDVGSFEVESHADGKVIVILNVR